VNSPTRARLREWTANLEPDRPLDVSDPEDAKFYVELDETGRGAVDRMQEQIETLLDVSRIVAGKLEEAIVGQQRFRLSFGKKTRRCVHCRDRCNAERWRSKLEGEVVHN
jgi:signal transduction histidine kinase